MHLKCCYSSCKSDSRKSEPGIKFMPFLKPNKLPNISQRWVHLCARKEFKAWSTVPAKWVSNGREGISQSPHNLARKQKQMRNSLRSLLLVDSVAERSSNCLQLVRGSQASRERERPIEASEGEIRIACLQTICRPKWEQYIPGMPPKTAANGSS